MKSNCAILCVALSVPVSLAGCQKGPTVEFGKVQGVVRVNGHPQRAINIQFSPDPGKGNGLPAFAGGMSDDQGNYTLKYSFKDQKGDGAPVGWQRVTLVDSTVGAPAQGQQPRP